MGSKLRNYKRNTYYHVFNRGNRKQLVFYKEGDYQFFIDKMSEYLKFFNIRIDAYCLMPNHFHLLIYSGKRPEEISLFMHRFMTSFCMYENNSKNLVGRTFQGVYKVREIEDDEDFRSIVNYLRNNPIKEGFVEKAEYYKWLHIKDRILR